MLYIYVENKGNEDEDNTSYTKQQWSDVVANGISKKLKDIPVEGTTINKEGKGCVFFPSKEAQEKAKQVLNDDFTLVSKSKPKRNVLPKLKIFNVNFTDKDVLMACIIEKNNEIAELINKCNTTFEVILIDSSRKYAIVKVSPDIRSAVLKKGRIFVGMQGLTVRDHFCPLQCYACQKFGHKKGSSDCEKDENTKTCLYCSKNHLSKDCDVKKKPEHHKCANCSSSHIASYRNNANHAATSFKCPIYMRETNALIRRTVGLESEESNMFLR